jgi:hypothetical protein
MRGKTGAYRFWWRDLMERVGVYGAILLKWISKKLEGKACTGSGYGKVVGACECIN